MFDLNFVRETAVVLLSICGSVTHRQFGAVETRIRTGGKVFREKRWKIS